MTIVSNTSPIANLAGIGKLNLLYQLYGTITIPQAVYNEMAGLSKTVPGTLEVQILSWITTQSVTDLNQVASLRAVLDQGEAEAITLASELDAELPIVEESPGRPIAKQCGINIIITIHLSINAGNQQMLDVLG